MQEQVCNCVIIESPNVYRFSAVTHAGSPYTKLREAETPIAARILWVGG
jgi:hypothetical protein